ncbi:MAG TPA: choice-of-anchor Q domain-containing protein [Candidatus Kapabacteria bacterium]|nr:choice-of-anchor Q domain-containing protein [Candidatus Kapabacteria bacterium]
MKRTLLVAIICCIASWSSARTVKVSTYPELYSACQAALANDTIILAKGIYTINDGKSRIYISGRSGPVLVKGETGDPHDVIVEGQGQENDVVQMVFNLDNCPNWTFEAMTVRNSYYHGFKFDHNSSNCLLNNLILLDHGSAAIKGTSDNAAGTYPDNLVIMNSTIGYTSIKGGTRDVVEGLDAVGVKGWVIAHNRFINVQKTGGDGIAYGCFTKGNSQNTTIIGNRFEDCFIGASFGGGGTDPQFFRDNDQTYEQQFGVIVNNVFVRCNDAAIYINKCRDARIYNNTVFDCGLTIQLRFKESTGEALNNLVKRSQDNPNEPVIRLRDGATITWDTMNLAATDADFISPIGTSDKVDLHLQKSSAAVDAAICLFAAPFDFDSVSRFNAGKSCDVGAYEFVPSAAVPDTRHRTALEATYDYELSALQVDLPETGILEVTFYNELGNLVKPTSKNNCVKGGYCFPVDSFRPGVYVAIVKTDSDSRSVKFTVVK